ncbi:MAG: leucine-rich repeat domain-containing protein [Candidatus Thorarchaeota archaeon]
MRDWLLTITLTYTNDCGDRLSKVFDRNVETITLFTKHIEHINLDPLASCASLKLLDLGQNQIRDIDLQPLSSCLSLKKLNLTTNLLQNIDLTPLSSCSNLTTLTLAQNELKQIDLSPLSSCLHFEHLELGSNYLRNVDLTPLLSCSKLRLIGLWYNRIKNVDVTALRTKPRLLFQPQRPKNAAAYSWLQRSFLGESASYDRPATQYSWTYVHQVTRDSWNDRRVQQDMLLALGLGRYGFIERNLSDLFSEIPPDTNLEMAQGLMLPAVLEAIAESSETGGPTTGLHLEEFPQDDLEIMKYTPGILETRRAEIEQVGVGVSELNYVDLRELWLTAYGYEVLSALDMRFATDKQGLERVKRAFAELGFRLRIGKTSTSGVKMSEELKQAIWWIVKNKGRLWSEIREQEDGGE